MDHDALDRLVSALYTELHAHARRTLAGDGMRESLRPTELVHEVYLRLRRREMLPAGLDRTQFLALAARTIRWVLVDEHRKRQRRQDAVGCATTIDVSWRREPLDLMAFDEQLNELDALSPRMRQVVELRVFGGLTVDEIAKHLDVSERTVKGDWATARAWLRRGMAP